MRIHSRTTAVQADRVQGLSAWTFEENELPIKWVVDNQSFLEAREALVIARDRMDYSSPCQRDPDLFDPPKGGGNGSAELMPSFRKRARAAIRLCAGCQVFSQCSVMHSTMSLLPGEDPETSGIVAGHITLPTPRSHAKIQEAS